MKVYKAVACFIFTVLVLFSCYYQTPDSSAWDIPKLRCDSLSYPETYHITFNSNLELTADSLSLHELFVEDDVGIVRKGDKLVIADFMLLPQDTIDSLWIKVAHDQLTMGWVRSIDLLSNTVPVEPVSKFIYLFSNLRGKITMIVFAAFLLLMTIHIAKKYQLRQIYYNDIDSIYPVLLSVLVACAATLYSAIQISLPEMWQYFYYNPSLNPFVLPGVMACFITLYWIILVVAVAVLDDVFRKTSFPVACSYLMGLTAFCLLLYMFFTFVPLYYIGYPCLGAYLLFSAYRLYTHAKVCYLCGNCGTRLSNKGVCPHCGAVNQ